MTVDRPPWQETGVCPVEERAWHDSMTDLGPPPRRQCAQDDLPHAPRGEPAGSQVACKDTRGPQADAGRRAGNDSGSLVQINPKAFWIAAAQL
jgi:hypothetical protein